MINYKTYNIDGNIKVNDFLPLIGTEHTPPANEYSTFWPINHKSAKWVKIKDKFGHLLMFLPYRILIAPLKWKFLHCSQRKKKICSMMTIIRTVSTQKLPFCAQIRVATHVPTHCQVKGICWHYLTSRHSSIFWKLTQMLT